MITREQVITEVTHMLIDMTDHCFGEDDECDDVDAAIEATAERVVDWVWATLSTNALGRDA